MLSLYLTTLFILMRKALYGPFSEEGGIAQCL